MKKGTTVGLMFVCAGVLLATLTSVYAFHTFHGGGRYFIDPPGIFAEFQLNPHSVHVKVAQKDDSTSFQMVAVSKTIDDFEIPSTEHTVTITGEMISITVLQAGPETQIFTETVPFTVYGEDNDSTGTDPDFFSLTVEYSASQAQGQLFEPLFGTCDTGTCTITFAGQVVRGNLFIHTSGGQ
jgi:hypothetical protein